MQVDTSSTLSEVIDIIERNRAKVVGIGEGCHGDLLSWDWRFRITKALIDRGHRVTVACEQLDFYITDLRNKSKSCRFHFTEHDGVKTFHPCLMPFSDRTVEHLEITKKFATLPVDIYGIDTAVLRFHDIWSRTRKSKVRDIISQIRKQIWAYMSDGDKVDPASRNALNAQVVMELADRTRGIIVYFAHNGHVALDCNSTRRMKRKVYFPDGAIMKRCLETKYVAIATHSPKLWNVWGGGVGMTRVNNTDISSRFKGVIVSDTTTNGTKRLDDEHATSDFDAVIVEPTSRRMRLL